MDHSGKSSCHSLKSYSDRGLHSDITQSALIIEQYQRNTQEGPQLTFISHERHQRHLIDDKQFHIITLIIISLFSSVKNQLRHLNSLELHKITNKTQLKFEAM